MFSYTLNTIIRTDTNNKISPIAFNEINTLPGFTSISMYPMLWGAKGIEKKELVEQLIGLAHIREINL